MADEQGWETGQEEAFFALYEYLSSLNVDPEWARIIAGNFYKTKKIIDMSDYDLYRMMRPWIEAAFSEERQTGLAMYGAYVNPRTGRTWDDEMRMYGGHFDPRTGEFVPGEGVRGMQTQAAHTQAMSRVKAQQQQGAEADRMRQWYGQFGEFPSYGQVTEPFLEEQALSGEFSPAMRRYYERALGGMYEGAGMPGKRRAWWEARTKYPGPEIPGAGDTTGMSIEDIAEAESGRVEQDYAVSQQLARPDPWQSFLKSYPFLQRYKALTPRERRYYSSQFRPRTRFL
jgi:hypothetical protein